MAARVNDAGDIAARVVFVTGGEVGAEFINCDGSQIARLRAAGVITERVHAAIAIAVGGVGDGVGLALGGVVEGNFQCEAAKFLEEVGGVTFCIISCRGHNTARVGDGNDEVSIAAVARNGIPVVAHLAHLNILYSISADSVIALLTCGLVHFPGQHASTTLRSRALSVDGVPSTEHDWVKICRIPSLKQRKRGYHCWRTKPRIVIEMPRQFARIGHTVAIRVHGAAGVFAHHAAIALLARAGTGTEITLVNEPRAVAHRSRLLGAERIGIPRPFRLVGVGVVRAQFVDGAVQGFRRGRGEVRRAARVFEQAHATLARVVETFAHVPDRIANDDLGGGETVRGRGCLPIAAYVFLLNAPQRVRHRVEINRGRIVRRLIEHLQPRLAFAINASGEVVVQTIQRKRKSARIGVTIRDAAGKIIARGCADDGGRNHRHEVAVAIVFVAHGAPGEIRDRRDEADGVIGHGVRAVEIVHDGFEPACAVVIERDRVAVVVNDL